MAKVNVKCKYCNSENVIFKGTQNGKRRCSCKDCNKSFQLSYLYKAYENGVKDKIVPMAHNGSGIRDTARVLGINKNTVISHLKNKQTDLVYVNTKFLDKLPDEQEKSI